MGLTVGLLVRCFAFLIQIAVLLPRSIGGGRWFRTRTKAAPRTRLSSGPGPLVSRDPALNQGAVCRGVKALYRTRSALTEPN